MPWGPGKSQGQDYCRESNFHKDLRSAGILIISQGPCTIPSCPIPLLIGHCAIHFPLLPDPLSTPPCPDLGFEGPWIVSQAPCLSTGFGQRGAPAERKVGEEAVHSSPLHLPCLSGTALPQLQLLASFSFRPRVVTSSCSCRPGMLHYVVPSPCSHACKCSLHKT